MSKRSIRITGMHCAGCVAGVEKAIGKVESVTSVVVNLASESALIEYEDERFPAEAVRSAVESAGYQIGEQLETAIFKVDGMHCAGCGQRREDARPARWR